MIINLENNQIALFIKNTEGAKLPVDAKIPDSAALGISFTEFCLQDITPQKISFGLDILLQKISRFEIWRYFLSFKDALNSMHKSPDIDQIGPFALFRALRLSL